MLGELENDIKDAMGIDTVGIDPRTDARVRPGVAQAFACARPSRAARISPLSNWKASMANFSRVQLKVQAAVSAGLGLAGLVMYLSTLSPPRLDDFWAPYIIAIGGTGALLSIFGLVWLAITLAQLYTHLFNEERPIDSSQFGALLAGTAVGVVVLLLLVLPRVPATPPSRLPPDPAAQESLLRQDGNFRSLVTVAILMAGVAVVSIPSRRFFKK